MIDEKQIKAAISNMKMIYPEMKLSEKEHAQLKADIATVEQLASFYQDHKDLDKSTETKKGVGA